MRDHNGTPAPECADEAMRDALPALEHGRLTERERRAVESHLAVCASCADELALLREVRLSMRAAAPRLDLDRLAATVAAATRPAAMPRRADVIPLAPRLAARRPAASRWLGRGGLRAAAAALIVALGAGAVTVARQGEPTATTAATAAPAADAAAPTADTGVLAAAESPAGEEAATPRARRETAAVRGAHALGDGFDDLSDAELGAVLRAIEGEDASLPALEPAVLATEYRGGGA